MAMFFLGNSYHWICGVGMPWLSGTLRRPQNWKLKAIELQSCHIWPGCLMRPGQPCQPGQPGHGVTAWSQQMDVLMVYIFFPRLIQCWKGFVRLENISFR